jgi:hypothetical protein
MVFRRTKMHVGFYVETNGGTPQNTKIYNALNKAVKDGDVTSASVFFNHVDFNPVPPKFGMFDAADVWSFTGLLVATSMNNVAKAANIVNKFKLGYLYSNEDKNDAGVFNLLQTAKTCPIFTQEESEQKEVYRLTGVKPTLLNDFSIKDLIGAYNE